MYKEGSNYNSQCDHDDYRNAETYSKDINVVVYDDTLSEAFNSTRNIHETIEEQLNYYKIKQKEKYANMEAVRKNMYKFQKSPVIPSEDIYEAIHRRNNGIVMM